MLHSWVASLTPRASICLCLRNYVDYGGICRAMQRLEFNGQQRKEIELNCQPKRCYILYKYAQK